METIKYATRYTVAPLYAFLSLALVTVAHTWFFRQLYPYGWLSVLKFILSLPSLLLLRFLVVEFILRRPLYWIFGEKHTSDSLAVFVFHAMSVALIAVIYFLYFLLMALLTVFSKYGVDSLPLSRRGENMSFSTGILLCMDMMYIMCSLQPAWYGLTHRGKKDDAWNMISDMYKGYWRVFKREMGDRSKKE